MANSKLPKPKLPARTTSALARARRAKLPDIPRRSKVLAGGGSSHDDGDSPEVLSSLDVEEYANTVLDYYADDGDWSALFDRLDLAKQKLLNDCTVKAVAALLRSHLGQRFPSEAAKRQAIRAALDKLRSEVVADPDAFLRRCAGPPGQ
jgi:hypothetical protein